MKEEDWEESKIKIEVSYGILLALLGLPKYARAYDDEYLMSLETEARERTALVRDEVRQELSDLLVEIFMKYHSHYNPVIWRQLQKHQNVYIRYAAATIIREKFCLSDMLDEFYYLPTLPAN